MPEAFVEYLELFEYFGRGGMQRMNREQFESHQAEFDALQTRRPQLNDTQLLRLIELRDVLLRDRPLTRVLEQEIKRMRAHAP